MTRVKKRKGIEAEMVKHPAPSRATDALIGDEEQKLKQKRTKRNGEQVPNPTTLDHSVVSYNAQGSYSEPILFLVHKE